MDSVSEINYDVFAEDNSDYGDDKYTDDDGEDIGIRNNWTSRRRSTSKRKQLYIIIIVIIVIIVIIIIIIIILQEISV